MAAVPQWAQTAGVRNGETAVAGEDAGCLPDGCSVRAGEGKPFTFSSRGRMHKTYHAPQLTRFGTIRQLTLNDGYGGKMTPGLDLAKGYGSDDVADGCTGEAKPGSDAACMSGF